MHGLAGPTPAPPFNRLGGHVILLRSPAGQSKAGACGLILQIIFQNAAGTLTGLGRGFVIFVQQVTVVGVAGLIVGENRAVVGIVVFQIVFFGLSA